MPSHRPTAFASRAAAVLAALALAPAAPAQTDYFWNPTTGGSGTWDTATQMWNTSSTGTTNNYTWTNSGGERANFGNTAGTVTLGTNITAYGINFTTANYTIAGGGNTLTLSGPGGVINTNVAATISAPIAGTVGLTKTGTGNLTLGGANTYSGGTTVSGGTLTGTAQAASSPFGSGPVTLNMAALRLNGVAATTTTTVGDLTIAAASAAATGVSTLVVDNTAGGTGVTTTFAVGNLVRGGAGSVLAVTPVTGNLGTGTGTGEAVTFANGGALVTNGILPAWVVAQSSGSTPAVDFAGDGPNGVAVATYSSGDLTTSTNTSVVNQTTAPTVTGNVSAYALKTNQAVNLNGNTLALGNGAGQSGLILGGGSVTNGNVTFGTTEGMVYVQGTTALGSVGNTITSNGLTVSASGRPRRRSTGTSPTAPCRPSSS